VRATQGTRCLAIDPFEAEEALIRLRNVSARAWPGVLLLIVVSGCNDPTQSGVGPEAFVPTPELARAALSASLQSWRDGRPRGPVTVNAPALAVTVEVSDSYRSPDRPLQAFEILGPVGTSDVRGFAVRLSFDNPREEQVVRYLVVGKNPLWVFRQEDYERISHWEHKIKEDEEPAIPPSPPPKSPPHHD
jgi:hypothetical protein